MISLPVFLFTPQMEDKDSVYQDLGIHLPSSNIVLKLIASEKPQYVLYTVQCTYHTADVCGRGKWDMDTAS